MYYTVLFSQIVEQQHGAYDICQHGRYGDSVDVHSQHQHKEEVRRHIEYAAYEEADKRGAGIAVASEDGRLEVVKHDERHAAEVQSQISDRIVLYFRRNTQKVYDRSGYNIAQHCYEDPGRDRKRH